MMWVKGVNGHSQVSAPKVDDDNDTHGLADERSDSFCELLWKVAIHTDVCNSNVFLMSVLPFVHVIAFFSVLDL